MDTRTTRPKRSVLHATAAAERPAPALSRRHHTRAERERRLRLFVMAGVAAIILVALLIPAYGYYHEVIRLGDQPEAVIDGHTFSVEDYARYVGTWQAILGHQIAELQPLAQPPGAKPTDQPTPGQANAQVAIQSLQSQESGLTSNGLTQLTEAQLVLDEAQKRGMTASPSELNDALRWLMSPLVDSAQTAPGLPAAPTTLPVTNTVSLTDAQTALTKIVGQGKFLSSGQITSLILKPAVLKQKLVTAMAGSVPTSEEEVHARHILVATEAEAQTVRNDLVKGADFAAEAKKYSTDTSTKDNGGDLGWFGRGMMVPEFEAAAFSLKVGDISQPVKSSFGYHIIEVLAKDPNHPIDPAQLEQKRQQGYQTWLSKAQSDTTNVVYDTTAPKTTWVSTYVEQSN